MANETPAPKGLMDEDGRVGERVELEGEDSKAAVHWSTVGNVGPAMAVLAGLVLVAMVVPGLEFAQPWKSGDPVPFWNLLGRYGESQREVAVAQRETKEVEELAREVLAAPEETPLEDPLVIHQEQQDDGDEDAGSGLPPYVPHEDDTKPVAAPVELFTGKELDSFFLALAHSEARYEGAVTRAIHWGDSAIGVDGITSAIRRRLQARFGDSGHGYHLMAPPNTSYRHKGVKFRHNDRWSICFIIRKCRDDGHYGLGGATFKSTGGAWSRFRPDSKYSSGRVSRFDVFYAAQPKGGRLQLTIDGKKPVILSAKADQLEDRWHSIEVPDGDHELEVKALGKGQVRVFGVAMERDEPGVVWDGMALLGAFTKRMLNYDPAHLKAQLERRKPHLSVFMFGGNDMIRKIPMSEYIGEYRRVIRMVKTARPEIACVIMSPLDHGVRRGRRVVSQPIVQRMVDAQREVAKAEGCGFFDTFAAMGGPGAAGRWNRKRPKLVSGDLSHLTFKGQAVVGEMFYRGLMQSYVEWRRAAQASPAETAAADKSPAHAKAAATGKAG